jgi:hypothetical protein
MIPKQEMVSKSPANSHEAEDCFPHFRVLTRQNSHSFLLFVTVIFLPVVCVILTFISIIISYGSLLKQFLHLTVLIIVNFPVLFKGYMVTCVTC